MSVLKNLEFSNVAQPKSNRNSLNTLERAKQKFGAALDIQIAAAEAFASGKTSYTVSKKRYVTDEETGEKKRIDKDVDVRPWWFEKEGAFFVSPKYANKALELSKGKASINAGDNLHVVHTVLKTVKEALDAGDLDKVLEAQAIAARERMAKK